MWAVSTARSACDGLKPAGCSALPWPDPILLRSSPKLCTRDTWLLTSLMSAPSFDPSALSIFWSARRGRRTFHQSLRSGAVFDGVTLYFNERSLKVASTISLDAPIALEISARVRRTRICRRWPSMTESATSPRRWGQPPGASRMAGATSSCSPRSLSASVITSTRARMSAVSSASPRSAAPVSSRFGS